MGNMFSSDKKKKLSLHARQHTAKPYQAPATSSYRQTSNPATHFDRVAAPRTHQTAVSTTQTVNIRQATPSIPALQPAAINTTVRHTTVNISHIPAPSFGVPRPLAPVPSPPAIIITQQQTQITLPERLVPQPQIIIPTPRPVIAPVSPSVEPQQSPYDTPLPHNASTEISKTYKQLIRLIKRYVESCLEPELSKNSIIRQMDMQQMAQKGNCVFVDCIRFEDQDVFELEEEEEIDSNVCRFTVFKDSSMNERYMHNRNTFAKELKPKSGVVLWNFHTKKADVEGRVINSNPSHIEVMLKCSARHLEALINKHSEDLALITHNSPISRDRVNFLSKKVLPHIMATRNSLFSSIVSFLDKNGPQQTPTSHWRYNEFSSLTSSRNWTMFQQLNDSQKQAVRGALECPHFYMIHGPPGTGKSQTLVVILEALFKSNKKVLVCAESHNPIDNLLSKFVNTSEHLQSLTTDQKRAALIRIGASWLVDKKSKEFLLENRLREYKNNMRRLRTAQNHQSQDDSTHENKFKLALISKARMVFSTKCGLFNKLFRDHFAVEENKFDYAVVDEASQSFTAYTLMAIACAKKIIFAGDHKQLPPVIKNEAAKQELEVSLFERLIEHQKLSPPQTPVYTMLDTQYRMNELLMKFSNEQLYAGQVNTGLANRSLLLKDIVSNSAVSRLPIDKPIVWIKNQEHERCHEEGNATNHREALLVIKAIKELIRIGVSQKDIGVIVGYNSQRMLIFNLIAHDRSMARIGVNVDELMIATVDSFQGREREVIIFATTRSNNYKKIGFFKDSRRLNVAATRARRQLIIVGDHETLNCRKAKFTELFRVVQTHGKIIEEL